MQLSFFKSIKNVIGTQETLSFEDSRGCFTKFRILANKEDGRLYSPALYNGSPQRADANVVAMSCIVIDVDNDKWVVKNGKKEKVPSPSPTLPEDHEMNLGDIAYFWHSTHSNTADWPKFRYILMLSRDILPCEWQACFEGAYRMFGGDENIDSSCKDLSRSYYLPSYPKEHEAAKFAGYHDGELLDPDWLIEQSGMMVDYAEPQKAGPISKVGGKVEGRNNTLKAVVSACLERGEAFEKIVTEVMLADSRHGTPLFSDPAETQYAGIDPVNNACLFVARIAASHSKSASRKGIKADVPHIRTEAAYKVSETIEIDDAAVAASIMPLHDDILRPPGLLGDMAGWIESCAIKPQPVLSLAAAIAACGVLMGRKIQTETGLRTNLYIVGLGETSCGKENARQRVKDLFVAAGAHKLLGPEELASDTGLLRAVKSSPAILMQIDEIGHMLRAVKSDKASSFKADIIPTLMKLESAASSVMIGRGYASTGKAGKDGTEREDIVQPCVCLYGSSVPCRFLKALTPDEILDGFVPRMLVFESDNPNPRRRVVDINSCDPPQSLIDLISKWHDRPCGDGNLMGYTGHPKPKVIPFSDAARDMFAEFEEEVRTERGKGQHNGTAGLWGKTEATAMKLAMIYSCSEDFYATEIHEQAAMWGIGVMMQLTKNMVLRAEQHISVNQNESDLKKLLRDILESGPTGISHSDLYRRNRKHGTHNFKNFILALKEQQEVVDQIYQSKHRTGVKYVALAFAKEPKHENDSGNVKQYLGGGA